MSAILSSDDLNDFISPGVACIKPIETLPPSKPLDPSNPYEVTTEDTLPASELPPAQISLTDCLACSGCVTSAEAILVSLQSHAEVLNTLDLAPAIDLRNFYSTNEDGRLYVASVSPQTRASIATAFGVTESEAGNMVEQLLSGVHGLRSGGKFGNGFQWVVDTNVAREATLVLGADEVLHSLESGSKDGPSKPILTSSCPGWICYAEKTHPYVLPHLSRLKSPQALMGTLLKTALRRKLGVESAKVWHVAIMPCFDKKLEASREELTDGVWDADEDHKGVRDVDCVITTKELLMLADSRGIDFSTLPRTPVSDSVPFPDPKLQDFLFPRKQRGKSNPAAGTSGGNLHHILETISSLHPDSRITTTRGRNADVVEYSILASTGESIFKAARYYGFRNIQNLVRKLKPEKISKMTGRPIVRARKPGIKATGPEYGYVEVMACPGGCTNGGGQIKIDDAVVSGRAQDETTPAPVEQKQWLSQVDEAYFSGDEDIDMMDLDVSSDRIGGISPSYVKETMSYWSTMTGIDLGKLAYTSYREVVSDVGKKISETERVVEISSREGGGW